MKTRKTVIFLKLLPILIPFIGLFVVGIILAAAQSFGYLIPVKTEMKGLDIYIAMLRDQQFYISFSYSIYIAFTTTICSILFGTIMAYGIWRLPHNYQKLAIVYKIFLILPHITVAFIVMVIFSQSGLLSSTLYQLGLQQDMSQFPSLLYGSSGAGTIIAYVLKNTPFVMLMLLSIMVKIDEQLLQTSHMLGAGRIKTFFSITLPQLMPAIHSTGIILFLYSFGAFEIPFIFGQYKMLSISAYNTYFKLDLVHRPSAMAMLMMMFLFSIMLVFIYFKILSHRQFKGRKI